MHQRDTKNINNKRPSFLSPGCTSFVLVDTQQQQLKEEISGVFISEGIPDRSEHERYIDNHPDSLFIIIWINATICLLAAPGNLNKDMEKTLNTFKRQKREVDGVTANEFLVRVP